MESGTKVKTSLTLDSETLETAKEIGKEKGLELSAMVEDALKEYIKRHRKVGRSPVSIVIGDKKFLSLTEVTQILNITRQTASIYIKSGDMRATQIKGGFFIREDWLNDFLEKRTTTIKAKSGNRKKPTVKSKNVKLNKTRVKSKRVKPAKKIEKVKSGSKAKMKERG